MSTNLKGHRESQKEKLLKKHVENPLKISPSLFINIKAVFNFQSGHRVEPYEAC